MTDVMTTPADSAAGSFELTVTPWPGLPLCYVTVGCRHGHDVRGILPRGTRRTETRAMVGHLRRRHGREHGCGCASEVLP